MRRKKRSTYLLLLAAIFIALSLSDSFTQKARFFAVASVSPSWRGSQVVKEKALHLLSITPSEKLGSESLLRQIEELKRENQALSLQTENIKQWLFDEKRLEAQMAKIKAIDISNVQEGWRGYFKRRRDQLAAVLKLELKALPAKVMYREPASWSSFIWLDLGEKQNRALQEVVVAKNSPVLVGNTLVGVVEEVRESQCKVRLITDSNLFPAVRAARGGIQDQFFMEQIEGLVQLFQTRRELFESLEDETYLFELLYKMASRLESSQKTLYLAKGELRGCSQPLWRARGKVLKGIGFNYDFSDEEGGARDLRTGELISEKKGQNAASLLKEGDLLVTSGLDGIFPPGLEVAIVSKVNCLKEGSSSYEIEARALFENFSELKTVTILPPLERNSI